jgi:hypothetical protein
MASAMAESTKAALLDEHDTQSAAPNAIKNMCFTKTTSV